ncbi:MAG: type II toxin-antitoxin system HicB family antitoxin [Chloroflexi bacterium]|nr:type II toxin-antitoxin system HicB family antitoxin [Chloroflexota bacterium]
MSRYIVYMQPAEEGGFVIWCPALPGCVSQGETEEEALEMIRDAMLGYIESLKKHGDPVPPGIEDKVEKVEIVSA